LCETEIEKWHLVRTSGMRKSLFISVYLMLATAITVTAAQQVVATQDFVTWGGVLLTTAPLLLVLGWVMTFRNIARTSARMPAIIVMGLIGVIFAVRGYYLGGDVLAPQLAVVGFVGYLLYAFWYSSFGQRHSTTLEPGKAIPDFELRDVYGQSVSSGSLTTTPRVWLFHRGNWCPLCMAQIREIAAAYRELEELGVRVALVSPQPPTFTQGLARKFDVSFDFLTDEHNRAATALGIAHAGGLPMGLQALGYDSDTVLPTVVITGMGGRILWAHETDNYRIRPEPATYLKVLRDSRTLAADAATN
jgi:peroxiredoxin